MNGSQILVTSYHDPDLDGTACSIAYSEFLSVSGRSAQPVSFGAPFIEAQFVMEAFHITPPAKGEDIIDENSKIILVDASDTIGISPLINPSNVVEIIDHRPLNQRESFPNAKVQIEMVGSAATLIAERFKSKNISISHSSAALLYSAIISNTINLNATVTTNRDGEMAKWLLAKCQLPADYIHTMFAAKSQFTKPLIQVFKELYGTYTFGGLRIGIVQLEILHVKDFLEKNMSEILHALEEIKASTSVDLIFVTAIDIEKITNTFLTTETKSKEILNKALNVEFQGDIAVRKGALMRKSITPLLKVVIEK